MANNFNIREYVDRLVEENGVDIRKVVLVGCKRNSFGSVEVDLVEVLPTRKEKMSGYALIHAVIDKETAPKVFIPAFSEIEVEFARMPLGSDKVWINKFLGLERFENKEKEGE